MSGGRRMRCSSWKGNASCGLRGNGENVLKEEFVGTL